MVAAQLADNQTAHTLALDNLSAQHRSLKETLIAAGDSSAEEARRKAEEQAQVEIDRLKARAELAESLVEDAGGCIQ